MSLRRPAKDQPETFEFNSSSLDAAKTIVSKYIKEGKLNERLARGLKPLLQAGSTITKNAGEAALIKLSDKFDRIDDEYAGEIASWLDMAIELMQDGYKGAATKKLKQFNQKCKDVLKGKSIKSAFAEGKLNEISVEKGLDKVDYDNPVLDGIKITGVLAWDIQQWMKSQPDARKLNKGRFRDLVPILHKRGFAKQIHGANLKNWQAVVKKHIKESKLNELKTAADGRISYILGKGLIAAIIFEDPDSGNPDALIASQISQKCYEKGLLVVHTGRESIKLGPPLTIADSALIEGIEIINDSFNEVLQKK